MSIDKFEINEDELNQQIENARNTWYEQNKVKVSQIQFNYKTNNYHLLLSDKRIITFPTSIVTDLINTILDNVDVDQIGNEIVIEDTQSNYDIFIKFSLGWLLDKLKPF